MEKAEKRPELIVRVLLGTGFDSVIYPFSWHCHFDDFFKRRSYNVREFTPATKDRDSYPFNRYTFTCIYNCQCIVLSLLYHLFKQIDKD